MKKQSQKENQEEKQESAILESPIEKTLEKEKVNTEDYNLEIVRDYYGNVDPFYLSKKDPNYAYRFLRDEHKNIAHKTGNLLYQKGGWQICPREHLLKLGIKETDLSPDKLLRRGDQILAFMPKKLFDEKKKYKMEQAKLPMANVDRVLKHGDHATGGKEIHETMKGIQTKKELGM
jgi:hypothetical protein